MDSTFSRILYGGDYNPNQWPREIWEEDMRMFKNAHINSATINVFSWAKIQPSEETYALEELDDIVEMLSKENYDIVMATSTASLPAWMVKRYPEVARVDFDGRRHKFGHRHNACPNSPVYRNFATKMASKLAERYGSNPHVTCWHINNEYGGICYCENCEKAFRIWLRKKYGTIEALNKAWNLEFWGHTIYEWDEVVAPNELSDAIGTEKTAFAGISLDYQRFMSDSILSNYCMERDAVRAYDKDAVITTNLMGTYKGLDYFSWAKEMDVISWDNYPRYNSPWDEIAMKNDLMRGLQNKPFMLMEQTPSQQNWAPYNTLKRPGQMRAQSYQTVAHGGDSIQFFQLRRSQGGCEKFHGAVIAHAGTDNTRVYREIAQLGGELEMLSGDILGAVNESKVGIVFDWSNYWALEYASGPSIDLKYVPQIMEYYRYFYEKNISVDMIPVDGDFKKYDLVVAPVLYLVKEGVAEALEEFVAEGGTLVTTFMSGIVDQSDNVHLGGYPGPLRKLAGIWAEEIDALPPEKTNRLSFADGEETDCKLLCDILHLEGAECLASYASDFYAGTPAITRNSFGKGQTYYVGTLPDARGMEIVMGRAIADAGVEPVVEGGEGLEIVRRRNDKGNLYFVMNFSDEVLPLPAALAGKKDLLTGSVLEAGKVFEKFDVVIAFEEN